MKKMIMTLSVAILACANAFAEGNDSGGNFATAYTSEIYLQTAKKFLEREIKLIDHKLLNELAKPYVNEIIDWDLFTKIIADARFSPTKRIMVEDSPRGRKVGLILTYGQDGLQKYIEVLEPFAMQFEREMLTARDVEHILKLLIHETSHHFGIGTSPSTDYLSREFSEKVLTLIKSVGKLKIITVPRSNEELKMYFEFISRPRYSEVEFVKEGLTLLKTFKYYVTVPLGPASSLSGQIISIPMIYAGPSIYCHVRLRLYSSEETLFDNSVRVCPQEGLFPGRVRGFVRLAFF